MNPGSFSPLQGLTLSRGGTRGSSKSGGSSGRGSSSTGQNNLARSGNRSNRSTVAASTQRNRSTDQQPTDDQLEQLKEDLGSLNRDLQYEVLLDENVVQAKIVNTKTNEVIREIPPEEILSLRKKIDEFMGLLIDERR